MSSTPTSVPTSNSTPTPPPAPPAHTSAHIDAAGIVGLRTGLAFLIIVLGCAFLGTLFFFWKRRRAPKKVFSTPEPGHGFTMGDLLERDLESQRGMVRRTVSGETIARRGGDGM